MSETIVIFRLGQAPEELTSLVPQKAGPWRCLFWVAPNGSQAIASLLDALPEPDIDHVTEAMAAGADIGKYLASMGVIPAEVGPGPVYSIGFHSGEAVEVEAFLRDGGHALVPIFELDLEGDDESSEEEADPDRALYFAAMSGDLSACKRALKRGAKVGFEDATTGATPLHEAASGGHRKIVTLLIDEGANLEARLKGAKTTPLGSAITKRDLPVVKRLLKAGARTDVRYDRPGWMPLHAAVSRRAPKILAALVEAGADVNARTEGGKSALEIAVQEGHDPATAKRSGALIVQLRQAGADPEAKNDAGESATDLARSLGREHLVPFLDGPF